MWLTRCNYCGKEMTKLHQECVTKAAQDMDRLGIIHLVSTTEGNITASFQEGFMKGLQTEQDLVRSHTLIDDAIDDGILTLIAVFGTMRKFRSRVPPERLYHYSNNVFNSLMSQKYGSPVPPSKKFEARVKEYLREVKSIPLDKEKFDFFFRDSTNQRRS